jgi:hypothetical protein
MVPGPRRVRVLALVALLTAGACVPGRDPAPSPPETTASRTGTTPPAPAAPAGPALLLASSFERAVCGRWNGNRPPECEFGIEGRVEAGPFRPRTGDGAVRIDRSSENHMGVIADQPLPDGRAFVGIAFRIPEIPAGAIPDDPGHLQLLQLSPTDGLLPGWPVEVRLYADRTLGLARFRDGDAVHTSWRAPVDEWFYVVVEVVNGDAADQRLSVYGPDDRVAEQVVARLDTHEPGPHEHRTAQKVGGNTASLVAFDTFADDWYIAERDHGPLRIDAGGRPVP